ncbi:MAG: alpha-mannosidase [Candidatus Asgardarchaeia archaeon]
MSKKKVYVVPHFHYDTDWVMTEYEYAKIATDNIKKALEIMRKDKDFKYILDQQILLDHFRINYPTLWDELVQRVKENRIELVCGMYAMPDNLLPGPESEIRQILYGKLFMREEFGVDPKVGWMIDPFGHHAQTPQIWKKSGFEYYAFKRGYGGEPLSDFVWVGLDGSKIIAHHFMFGYENAADIPEDIESGSAMILDLCKREEKYATQGNILLLNGTDFTPPNHNITKIIKKANEQSKEYEIKVATPSEYFAEIEKVKSQLKEVRGELIWGRYHPVLPGCYSSRIDVKQRFRDLELFLSDVERFSTIAWLLGLEYPQFQLEMAWKYLLHNAFHDIICGCGIDDIYEDAERRFDESELIAEDILEDVLNYIATQINTEGDGLPFIVFNTLPYRRTEIATAFLDVSKLNTSGIKIVDYNNNEVPFEILDADFDEENKLTHVLVLLLAEDLPPVGYRVYYAVSSDSISVAEETDDTDIENEFFKISYDPNLGVLEQIYDKINDKDVLDGFGNDLEVSTDVGDLYYEIEPEKGFKVSSLMFRMISEYARQVLRMEIVRIDGVTLKSNLRSTFVINGTAKWRDTELIDWETRVTLFKKIPRIDFEMNVRFNYPHTILRVMFPVNINSEKFYSEIPAGVIERPKKVESSDDWKEKHFGTWPVQNWMDYTDGDYGVTLINRGLPEHRIDDNTIKLTLLRSVDLVSWGDAGPKLHAPNALMLGEHFFEYSLYPHKGSWKEAKSHIYAYSHNVKPLTLQATVHKGNLPKEYSFVEFDNDGIVLTAIKKHEYEDSIIVRFFETLGEEKEVTLQFNGVVLDKAYKTNLLEEEIEELPIFEDNKLTIKVGPFEIVTLKLVLSS